MRAPLRPSVRIELPSARAEASAQLRSRSACSRRHAARDTPQQHPPFPPPGGHPVRDRHADTLPLPGGVQQTGRLNVLPGTVVTGTPGTADASGVYQIIARRGRQCGVDVHPHRSRRHISHTRALAEARPSLVTEHPAGELPCTRYEPASGAPGDLPAVRYRH